MTWLQHTFYCVYCIYFIFCKTHHLPSWLGFSSLNKTTSIYLDFYSIKAPIKGFHKPPVLLRPPSSSPSSFKVTEGNFTVFMKLYHDSPDDHKCRDETLGNETRLGRRFTSGERRHLSPAVLEFAGKRSFLEPSQWAFPLQRFNMSNKAVKTFHNFSSA